MAASLGGVLPALITPLTEDRRINVPVLEKLLARVYAAGVHGVYVCGSTGEGMRLSVAGRKTVLEAAVRNSPPDKMVIAHVGAARLDDARELAIHAEEAGAHALSSLPPVGDFETIKAYYEELAAATSLPFLVYYFPEAAPGIRTLEQIRELCQFPNIVGLKFTDFDLYRMSLLTRSGLTVFNGRDEVFIAGRLMGAHGGIGSFYNLIPGRFVEAFNLTEAGQFAEARCVQDRINDLIAFTLRFPAIAAIKTMLEWTGLPCGPALASRPLTEEETAELRAGFEPLL